MYDLFFSRTGHGDYYIFIGSQKHFAMFLLWNFIYWSLYGAVLITFVIMIVPNKFLSNQIKNSYNLDINNSN
jgi:uncharacterized membrane protein